MKCFTQFSEMLFTKEWVGSVSGYITQIDGFKLNLLSQYCRFFLSCLYGHYLVFQYIHQGKLGHRFTQIFGFL